MARYFPKTNSVKEYNTAKHFFDVQGEGEDIILLNMGFNFSHTCCYCDTDQEAGLWSYYFRGYLPHIVFCEKHREIATKDYINVLVLLNEKK
jgi:hypothetical protein